MIIPQIVLNIHDIGTILGETTNKTIIIMYISLLFNKCINYKKKRKKKHCGFKHIYCHISESSRTF